jgi:plasmid stabilization system protein ParE
MERKVSWSKIALVRAEQITYYLKNEWGDRVADDFVNKLNTSIDVLCKYPYIGSASEKHNSVRKILVTKHNALFYKILKSKIYIADIFDTCQNPKKSKY